jgi:glutathione peroxidase-family protein
MNDLFKEFGEGKEGGLRILGFPCNQFGWQEPRSNDAIAEFAQSKNVKFDMMEKVDVNGENSSMVFMWLKMCTGTTASAITWNFGTYWLVTKDGKATRHDNVSPKDLHCLISDSLK